MATANGTAQASKARTSLIAIGAKGKVDPRSVKGLKNIADAWTAFHKLEAENYEKGTAANRIFRLQIHHVTKGVYKDIEIRTPKSLEPKVATKPVTSKKAPAERPTFTPEEEAMLAADRAAAEAELEAEAALA